MIPGSRKTKIARSLFLKIGEVKGWAENQIEKKSDHIQALCLPLISMLNAIGNPTVDYFSLDIEGVELNVLRTIPWDKVDIKVFKKICLEFFSPS